MRYELELKRGGRSTFAAVAEPLDVGDEVEAEGRQWRVAEVRLPDGAVGAIVRYVCTELTPEDRSSPPEPPPAPTG